MEPRQVRNENLFTIWSYDGMMVYESIILKPQKTSIQDVSLERADMEQFIKLSCQVARFLL